MNKMYILSERFYDRVEKAMETAHTELFEITCAR